VSDIIYKIEFSCESEMRKGAYRINGIRPEKVRLKDGTFLDWHKFLADEDGLFEKDALSAEKVVKKEYHTADKDNNQRTDYETYTVSFKNSDGMPFGVLWARWENYVIISGQPVQGKKTLTYLTSVFCDEDGKIQEKVQ
jgi:hypothetical protein